MKAKIGSIALVVLTLAGCAGGTQLAPEQREALMRYSLEQQRLNNQAAQDLSNAAGRMVQPVPQMQSPAAAPILRTPTQCASRRAYDGAIVTECR